MARYKDKPQKKKRKDDPRFDSPLKPEKVNKSARKPEKRFFWLIVISAGMFILILEAVILLTMKDGETAVLNENTDKSGTSGQSIVIVDGAVVSGMPSGESSRLEGSEGSGGLAGVSSGGTVSGDTSGRVPVSSESHSDGEASSLISQDSRPESGYSNFLRPPVASETTSFPSDTSSPSSTVSGVPEEKKISLSAESTELILTEEKSCSILLQMEPSGCAVRFSGDTDGFDLRQEGDTVIIIPHTGCKEKNQILLTARKSGYAPAELALSVTVRKPLDEGTIYSLTDKLYIAINNARMEAGVPPLSRLSELDSGAQKRATEAAERFSSIRPDGSEFYTAYTPGPNYNYAENLMKGCSTAEEAFAAWMASPGHRDNMLDENYTGLGLGVYRDERGNWFWAEHFYRP